MNEPTIEVPDWIPDDLGEAIQAIKDCAPEIAIMMLRARQDPKQARAELKLEALRKLTDQWRARSLTGQVGGFASCATDVRKILDET